MSRKRGFTLIEVLLVISILAILLLASVFSLTRQRDKADNARIKADLSRLKITFEDYYNDYNCYPPAEWFDGPEDCGSDNLSPYLNQIPCDPHTHLPYIIETDTTGCTWFKLYGYLFDPGSDPQALAQYSDDGSTLGNYGVSSSNTTVSVNFTASPPPSPVSSSSSAPTPTPTPSSTSSPLNRYYCQDTMGNCSEIGAGQTCNPSYSGPNCDGNDQIHCRTIVSSCSPL